MEFADLHFRDHDRPAVRKRRTEVDAFVVDSDLVTDWPVTEEELASIGRLLGDDIVRLLRGNGRN
jgi:hypothetical protein